MDELTARIKLLFPSLKLGEPLIKAVIERLKTLSYIALIEDAQALGFSMQSVYNSIISTCGIADISIGLYEIAVNRICGEFLFFQKQNGKFASDLLDFKSVKLGDASFDLGNGTNTSSDINLMIETLRNDGDLLCFRKLKW